MQGAGAKDLRWRSWTPTTSTFEAKPRQSFAIHRRDFASSVRNRKRRSGAAVDPSLRIYPERGGCKGRERRISGGAAGLLYEYIRGEAATIVRDPSARLRLECP